MGAVRKNGLTVSVLTDIYLGMSASAAQSLDNVVSLDEYRRTRASGRKDSVDRPSEMTMQAPRLPGPHAPVWVYWVPVWIW